MALNENAIVTIGDLKTYLKIAGDGENAILEFLINRVSTAVENCLRRKVKKQTVTDERHSGTGLDPFVILEYAPVVSITSLYDDTGWEFGDDTLLVEDTDFVVDKTAGIIHKKAGVFTCGSQNIKATYEAGWDEIPQDIVFAAEIQVALEYKRWKDMRLDRASERKGDGTVTYLHTNWHPEALKLLDPWVRRG